MARSPSWGLSSREGFWSGKNLSPPRSKVRIVAQDSPWTEARSRPLLDWMVAQVNPLLPETLPSALPATLTPAGPARDLDPPQPQRGA